MTAASDSDLAALRHALGTYEGVQMALLFGSRARGEASQQSDFDLAVAGNDIDTLKLAGALELALGAPVDVVDLEADVPIALLQEILHDGKCVFEDAPGRHATWRARALWDVETDAPMLERQGRLWLQRVAQRGIR